MSRSKRHLGLDGKANSPELPANPRTACTRAQAGTVRCISAIGFSVDRRGTEVDEAKARRTREDDAAAILAYVEFWRAKLLLHSSQSKLGGRPPVVECDVSIHPRITNKAGLLIARWN